MEFNSYDRKLSRTLKSKDLADATDTMDVQMKGVEANMKRMVLESMRRITESVDGNLERVLEQVKHVVDATDEQDKLLEERVQVRGRGWPRVGGGSVNSLFLLQALLSFNGSVNAVRLSFCLFLDSNFSFLLSLFLLSNSQNLSQNVSLSLSLSFSLSFSISLSFLLLLFSSSSPPLLLLSIFPSSSSPPPLLLSSSSTLPLSLCSASSQTPHPPHLPLRSPTGRSNSSRPSASPPASLS